MSVLCHHRYLHTVNWPGSTVVSCASFPRSCTSLDPHQVVLQAGDVLYLPTNYFHHIVSLNTNLQCNARSGVTQHYMKEIKDCGFAPPGAVG